MSPVETSGEAAAIWLLSDALAAGFFGERRGSHLARAATRLSVSMPRLSFGSRYFSRNATGSTPAAAASSSTKHSFAYVFCMRPGVRIHEGRNGVVSSRWHTVLILG